MALLLTMALALSTLAQADEGAGSALASDERVVFFTTDATLSADGESWNVPIHAWVHELENAAMRRTTIATLLRKQYGIVSTPKTKAVFDRRVRLIIADNERNKSIVIEMAGSKWTLNKTQPNGHSLTLLSINSEKVKQYAKDGQLSFKVANADNDSGSFIGFVNLVSGTGVSVISDFDDTVKVTNVTERAKMLENSLYNEFQSVVGMPLLYRQWAKQGAAFHFVSSSPWQLYEPIDEFLQRQAFPKSSLSLKSFRFRDDSLFNILKPGLETKPAQINKILNAFPQRDFVLVGDSGEQDPEVYARIYKDNPHRIKAIFIRNITNAQREDKRFSVVFDQISPDVWVLFDEPTDLMLPID